MRTRVNIVVCMLFGRSLAAFLTQTVCLNDTTVKFEIWDTGMFVCVLVVLVYLVESNTTGSVKLAKSDITV
jgi:hypothetical protein